MPDTLDIEDSGALIAFLRTAGRIAPDEIPTLTNLAGGVSNRTVLLVRPSGEAWVLKQALAKLRVKVEWFSDPRRIEREATGMQRLAELAPPGTIPKLVFIHPEHHLLAMEAVPQPHENWKTVLLRDGPKLDHVAQLARLLGQVHRRAWERRETLAGEFDDRSFFQSLRVEPYYLYAAQQAHAARNFLHDLVNETRRTRYTLVHGDYSPKNILIHNNRLVLLDHEVIHYGDGAFDLGFSLAHLLSKAHHLRDRRSHFVEAVRHYWREYLGAIGNVPWRENLEPRAVRHALGCLLARCIGRSPLEYLSEEERQAQARAVIELISEPPPTIEQLSEWMLARI